MSRLGGCLLVMICVALAAAQLARGEPPAGKTTKTPESSKLALMDSYSDPLPPGAVARLGTIRLRHVLRGDVGAACLVFSPDSKVLISGGDTGLCAWEM